MIELVGIKGYSKLTKKSKRVIALEAGYDPSVVTKWLTGRSEPMRSTVEAFTVASNGVIQFEDVYQEYLEARAKRSGRQAA